MIRLAGCRIARPTGVELIKGALSSVHRVDDGMTRRQPGWIGTAGGSQVADLKAVGVAPRTERERFMAFAQITGALAVTDADAGVAHRVRQNDVGRQSRGSPAAQMRYDRTVMRIFLAATEQIAR